MKAKIVYINEAGEESVENIRWLDEIAEAEGMSDAEADAMEIEIGRNGRYWLAHNRCVWRIQP